MISNQFNISYMSSGRQKQNQEPAEFKTPPQQMLFSEQVSLPFFFQNFLIQHGYTDG